MEVLAVVFVAAFVLAAFVVGMLDEYLDGILQLAIGVLLSGVFTWVVNHLMFQVTDKKLLTVGFLAWLATYLLSAYWGFRLGRRMRNAPHRSH